MELLCGHWVTDALQALTVVASSCIDLVLHPMVLFSLYPDDHQNLPNQSRDYQVGVKGLYEDGFGKFGFCFNTDLQLRFAYSVWQCELRIENSKCSEPLTLNACFLFFSFFLKALRLCSADQRMSFWLSATFSCSKCPLVMQCWGSFLKIQIWYFYAVKAPHWTQLYIYLFDRIL